MTRFLRLTPVPLLLMFSGSICTSACAQAPAAAPSSTKAAPDPMLTDSRLERRITLEHIALPLPELLKKLGGSELLLIAAKNCETQKIQLRVQNRTVRSVMLALAQLLPGSWREADDKKGYTLRMSDLYERKRETWWRLFEEEREAAFGRMKENLLRELQRGQKFTEEDGTPLKDKELQQEFDALQRLCKALPNEVMEKIAGNIDRRPYFSSGPMGFGGFRDGVGDLMIPLAGLPDEAKRAAAALTLARLKTKADPAFLRAANGGFMLIFSLFDSEGVEIGGVSGGPNPGFSNLVFTHPNHEGLFQAFQMERRPLTALPTNWRKLLDYQRSTFWKEQKRPWPPPQILEAKDRADVLSWLGKNAGIEFISDYYTQGTSRLLPSEKAKEKVRPPGIELNHLALENDVSWKKSGDFYLVRSNRWYRNDRLEAPESVLAEWDNPWKKDGDLAVVTDYGQGAKGFKQFRERLDREAKVISSLTLWQLMNGFRYGVPPSLKPLVSPDQLDVYLRFEEKVHPQNQMTESSKRQIVDGQSHPQVYYASAMLNNLFVLQFYASLDPLQRDHVLKGELPVETLTSAQREAVFVILPELIPLTEQQDRPYRLRLVPTLQQNADDYGGFDEKLKIEPALP